MAERLVCIGCGHDMEGHFRNVVENVVCLHTDSGVSDRGVIGIPYSHRCDCLNYASRSAIVRAEFEAYEEERRREMTEQIIALARKEMVG